MCALAQNLHALNLVEKFIPLFTKTFSDFKSQNLSKSPLDFPFHHHHTENDFHPNEEAWSINQNVGQPRYFRLSASSAMVEKQDQKYIGGPPLFFFPLSEYIYLFGTSLLLSRYIHMIQNMLTVKIVPFKVLQSTSHCCCCYK